MKFKLEFSTDNAAFEDNGVAGEINGIAAAISMSITEGYQAGRVRDSNGNTIGHWSLQ